MFTFWHLGYMKHFLTWILLFFLILTVLQSNGQEVLFPYRKGNKWGFADENRQLKIPSIYDKVAFFTDTTHFYRSKSLNVSYALVTIGDTSWLINKKGEPFYAEFQLDPFHELSKFSDGLLYSNVKSGVLLLNRSLEIVHFISDCTIDNTIYLPMSREEEQTNMPFGVDIVAYSRRYNQNEIGGRNMTQTPNYWNNVPQGQHHYLRNKTTKLYGILNADGRIKIAPKYHQISNFWQGKVICDHTIIDTFTQKEVHTPFRLKHRISDEGLIQVQDTISKKIGFVDSAGKVIIVPQFLRAYGFYSGKAFCQNADSSWGIFNTQGTQLLPVFFDKSKPTNHYIFTTANSDFVLDNQGIASEEEFIWARQSDNYWHCYDWNIHEITRIPLDAPPLYVDWRGLKGFIGKKDGLLVFFDREWKLLLRPQFKRIEDANHQDFFSAYRSQATLLVGINEGVKTLLNLDFREIGDAVESKSNEKDSNQIFKENKKLGLLDSTGILLIAPDYDQFFRFDKKESAFGKFGSYLAQKNGRFGILKSDGRVGLPFVFKTNFLKNFEDFQDCNPFAIKYYLDSLDGVFHFANSIGIYHAMPDSIQHFWCEEINEERVVFAQTKSFIKYKLNKLTGLLIPTNASIWSQKQLNFYQKVRFLQDSVGNIMPKIEDKNFEYVVSASNDSLILIYLEQQTEHGTDNCGAILDAKGKVLLSHLEQINCEDGLLSYIENGTYRQWNTPLLGQYKMNPMTYRYHENKDFLAISFACNREPSSNYATGLFKKDGTCMLPAKCGQTIDYFLQLDLFLIKYQGLETLFDAKKAIFYPEASHFLQYWDKSHWRTDIPKGYFWIDLNHKPGLVRLMDGATFFED
jgi:WG containing repeat